MRDSGPSSRIENLERVIIRDDIGKATLRKSCLGGWCLFGSLYSCLILPKTQGKVLGGSRGRTLWTAGHALDGFWVQTIASQSVARQTSLPGNKIAPQQIRL